MKDLESIKLGEIILNPTEIQFCNTKEIRYYRELINNPKISKIYQNGITNILKKVFNQFWVKSNKEEMSGFYGIESTDGRSILNNLNTNFNTFCLLTKIINTQIDSNKISEKKFNFSQKEKRNLNEVIRLIKLLNYFKKDIFTKNNKEFLNIIKVLKKLWDRGQESENIALSKIKNYFGVDSSIEKIGGHGQKNDAFKGIDLIINLDNKKHTSQVKPFSNLKKENSKITIFDTGNVKSYNVDWLIFINTKSKKILIFKNNPIKDYNQYVFNESSLLHEIE
jgi:hypothetical protein